MDCMMYTKCSTFFFFSSRRRHTRYWRDWSSDVCSSDLEAVLGEEAPGARGRVAGWVDRDRQHRHLVAEAVERPGDLLARSGERRVGEECRSWWSPYH